MDGTITLVRVPAMFRLFSLTAPELRRNACREIRVEFCLLLRPPRLETSDGRVLRVVDCARVAVVVRPRFGLRACAVPLAEDDVFDCAARDRDTSRPAEDEVLGCDARDRDTSRSAEDEDFGVERRVSVPRASELDACLFARDLTVDRPRDDG